MKTSDKLKGKIVAYTITGAIVTIPTAALIWSIVNINGIMEVLQLGDIPYNFSSLYSFFIS
jgi:hypothetical protein